MANKPKLSIVIPTLNEEKDLPNLLESIKKQNFKNYEIIIADNNSKDNTRKIAKKYKCNLTKGGLPPVGRNNGVKIAKGDYILFLDADVILPYNFIRDALKEFEERYLEAATCEFIPLSDKKIDQFLHKFSNGIIRTLQYIKPFGAGFCILVTKRIHNRINGFNESLRLCEDHDYLERISKLGTFRILKNPKVYVSTRRLEKEGRRTLALKYAKATIYQLTNQKDKMKEIDYEFGNYNREL